jgi:hypothetical protein
MVAVNGASLIQVATVPVGAGQSPPEAAAENVTVPIGKPEMSKTAVAPAVAVNVRVTVR